MTEARNKLMQSFTCPHCKAGTRLPGDMTFVSMSKICFKKRIVDIFIEEEKRLDQMKASNNNKAAEIYIEGKIMTMERLYDKIKESWNI